MKTNEIIIINQLCRSYQIEFTFFEQLEHLGLIKILSVQEEACIEENELEAVEKMIRLYQELNVHPQSMDVVMNLLQKVEDLQDELRLTQIKLKRFEDLF